MTLVAVPPADLSPLERYALMDPAEAKAVFARLSFEERRGLLSWSGQRRPTQTPPMDDDWLVWLFMAGRGSGKTRSAAEDLADRLEVMHYRLKEVIRAAVITPTFGDYRDTAVEGESGLLAVLNRRGVKYDWNRGNGELFTERWEIKGYSSVEPNRLRGPQFHVAWLEEPASFRFPKAVWDTLLPALRLGPSPKVLVTGTPKVTWLMRHLVAQCKANPLRYRLARSATWRNRANLPDVILEELERAYGGTTLGRQELEGELLEEAEGALWTLAQIEADRALDPSMRQDLTPPGWVDLPSDLRVVVGVDPAVSNTPDSDETGIVVAGATRERFPHGYVLADLSGRMSPQKWARRVIDACIEYGTSRVVAEVNQGGDLVESNINTARVDGDPVIHVEKIHAKKSKALRAGPVSTLYEQHRVHHLGTFGELETQQVTWVPGDEESGQDSPDRVDALVYAILDLMDRPAVGGGVSVMTGRMPGM